jgi:hypothetical protein
MQGCALKTFRLLVKNNRALEEAAKAASVVNDSSTEGCKYLAKELLKDIEAAKAANPIAQ